VLSGVWVWGVFGSAHGTRIAKYITFRRGEFIEALLGPRQGGVGPDRRSRLFLLGRQVSDLTCPLFQQDWSISDGSTEDQIRVLGVVSGCISGVYKRFS
jgi:hypothetical protein